MSTDLYVRYSGAWRQIKDVQTKLSGSWTRVREVHVNSGGTWRRVFPTVSMLVGYTGGSTWGYDANRGTVSPNAFPTSSGNATIAGLLDILTSFNVILAGNYASNAFTKVNVNTVTFNTASATFLGFNGTNTSWQWNYTAGLSARNGKYVPVVVTV